VRFVDDRLGASKAVKKALRYVFPDHWSFMLGEIALYCFVVLVATGVFLAFFFSPSDSDVVYRGVYEPLRGAEVSEAYGSVVNLSFDVPAGLLVRQVHHWAADIFVVAIVLHLLRVFFTAAFRKPRDINYYVGVTMLGLALLEGFLGYSLVDDLLSGMGLAIAYSVLMSVPLIGDRLTVLAWGDAWPGSPELWPRMFIAHVLIIPLVLAALISLHLTMIMRHHHTQFRGPRRTEHNVVGTPMWSGYALRSLGLACAVVAVLALLGGLVQINPIWEWGPFHTADATNGAQPDWYLGWLIGGLRLVPGWEPVIGGYTLVPNPFWGGVFFPTVVFAILYAWPWLDRRRERDARTTTCSTCRATTRAGPLWAPRCSPGWRSSSSSGPSTASTSCSGSRTRGRSGSGGSGSWSCRCSCTSRPAESPPSCRWGRHGCCAASMGRPCAGRPAEASRCCRAVSRRPPSPRRPALRR
jgi:ubiquinol-cytochrome c reductase cytochrome b subunit